MKNLLLAVFLLCAVAARAQNTPPPVATGAYRYCALVVDDRYFSQPSRLQLDYGPVQDDPDLVELAKNIRGARSVVDALNYLSRHGWECFNVTTVQLAIKESTTSRYIESETRYLCRRR